MNVFLLWHVHEILGGEEDAKLVGVYSSRDLADGAQKRVIELPGFRDAPDGFTIDSHEVDQDGWQEGYIIAHTS
ncbi:MAG TPA: hypothetical protein PLA50_05255 [Bacteroidia bacterium]|nr:hypothetical protein [Bacteroidia bacterium]